MQEGVFADVSEDIVLADANAAGFLLNTEILRMRNSACTCIPLRANAHVVSFARRRYSA
jgi:hypothetical protein